MKKGYIYNLSDRGDIFYVGCTINPIQRLYIHNLNFRNFECGGFGSPKKHFKGVDMEIIDEIDFTDRKELFKLETYWIHQFIAWGFELFNISYLGANIKGNYNYNKK